jgi:GNAT superfamily N-acetyltransferase
MSQAPTTDAAATPQVDPDITFRPYRQDDFDEVAKICARIWVPDVEGYFDRITFGRVMTSGSLRRSSFANVAVRGTHVVGECLGGFARDGAIVQDHTHDETFERLMVAARKRAKLGGPEVEEMLFRRLRMYTTADVFISRGYSNAEAELNLLVVNPADQGRGIGSRLFEDAVTAFCDGGAHGFFTMISDVPDFSFVENRGLSLVQKKDGPSRKSDRGAIYLYGRRL